MVSIARVIAMAAKLQGTKTKGTFTLGKDALQMAASRAGQKGELLFGALVKDVKDPVVDVAYKASKNGYTVGTFTLRDGKQVVGNGTVSVTGLGTENSVLKYRLNIGENGKVARTNGFIDNGQQVSLDDVLINASRKNGVLTSKTRYGSAAGTNSVMNEQEYLAYLNKLSHGEAPTEGYNRVINGANDFIGTMQGKFRDLIAGKSIEMTTPAQFADMIKAKLVAPDLKKIKISDEILEKVGVKVPKKHLGKKDLDFMIDNFKACTRSLEEDRVVFNGTGEEWNRKMRERINEFISGYPGNENYISAALEDFIKRYA